jgi:hypothetical protein
MVCPFQALVLLTLTSVFDLWQICWTDLYEFFARSSAALSFSRLRPVTLRAILSDGLPFSSFCYFKNTLLSLICGRFAGRIFMISCPAVLPPYLPQDLGQ